MIPSYNHASKLCPNVVEFQERTGDEVEYHRCTDPDCGPDGRVAVDVEEAFCPQGCFDGRNSWCYDDHLTRPALWSYVFVGDPVIDDIHGPGVVVAIRTTHGLLQIRVELEDPALGESWTHPKHLTLDLSGDFSHRDERLRP